MALNRQHGVTSDTYKKFYIDSGAVYKNYGESGELLLGATRGGNTFVIEQEIRDMPVDGARGKVVGGDRITNINAIITANFIEMSSVLMQLALPGSAVADYPVAPASKTHDSITRALDIALTDYATNIAIVGEVTGNDTVGGVVILSNGLSDGNFELGFTDKDESVLAITFGARFDPSDLDTEPWEIRHPVIA
ncbi:MAG: hypothetical protein KC517_09175 [Bacteroidetes bacterium]|nr:hypothetical protein [Bacteroidota bacterium]